MLTHCETQVGQGRESSATVIAKARAHTCCYFRAVEGCGLVWFPRNLDPGVGGT